MKTRTPTNRRKFLLAAGVGGAGAAALAMGTVKQAHQAVPEAATEQASGYRTTEHILKYYKTAKV